MAEDQHIASSSTRRCFQNLVEIPSCNLRRVLYQSMTHRAWLPTVVVDVNDAGEPWCTSACQGPGSFGLRAETILRADGTFGPSTLKCGTCIKEAFHRIQLFSAESAWKDVEIEIKPRVWISPADQANLLRAQADELTARKERSDPTTYAVYDYGISPIPEPHHGDQIGD